MPTMEPLAPLGRAPGNPLLTPADVPPSRPDFEVIGVFNPAVLVDDDGDTSLLLRVAERPRDITPDEVATPFYDALLGVPAAVLARPARRISRG